MRHRLLIDLRPLRASVDFRRLFTAWVVSMAGSQLTAVAIAYQLYSLTGSSLQIGALSIVTLVPFVAGTLAGGALADSINRRGILVGTLALLATCSAGLAFNAQAGGHASVIAIYLITALAAGLSAVASTATTGAIPALVGADLLTSSYASTQMIDQVGMVAGPATAGILLAAVGLPWLYAVDSVTYLWAAVFLCRMSGRESPQTATRPGLRSVIDAFRYLRDRQQLQGAYLIDLCATVFGLPRAVFPALTHTVFHAGPATLGLLYTTPAAGALAGTLSSGWLTAVRRQGRAVLIAVVTWGVAVIAFGFATALWLALVFVAIAGWADVISAVLRSAIVQSAVDEKHRNRVSGLQTGVVEGGPRLGDLESGTVASVLSPRFSVVSGGLLCIAGALLVAALLPGFRSYATHVNRDIE